LEGLAPEDVGIFYGHLVHFTVFCYISWTFGIVRGNLGYFPPFGILYQEKSGNPELPSGRCRLTDRFLKKAAPNFPLKNLSGGQDNFF
jgi:hypothetical protein